MSSRKSGSTEQSVDTLSNMFRLLAIRSVIFPFLRLVWRLLRDGRVSVFTKIIPLLALIYLVSPYDLVGDRIPILGQFDDLIVVGLLLFLFIAASPAHVVADLTIGKKLRDLQNQQGQKPQDKTVDAEIRYIDDEDASEEDEDSGNRRR
ncbi:MAG: DUF1232 domain-containing protein [Chloroflexi bacterium]|nr:DUF1232 domain-containing protein [Chloroflexota bacterium]MCI0804499.1 DUF1232 domain-containing protein [Chloroflexota bacterium]MCI0881342.1 DUF1232 domain-containing protein [Chloroflexota bacterium]